MQRKSLIAVLVLCASQAVEAQDLVIRRADGSERHLTAAELAVLPTTTFEAVDHGKLTSLTGVSLRTVLLHVAAGPVDSLRGAALRRVIVAEGADGYRALVALAELDASIGGRNAYVVVAAGDRPLPEAQGPIRLVVPGDGRAARWVRQLVRLEIHVLP